MGRVMDIVLVAAVAENGVIGRAGGLPWRLKSDLQQFRALTTGKPIVMGRRTWASLARPLPQRTNIVVTRDAAFTAPGAVVATSLAAALAVARGDALRRNVDAIMVIGGGDIYAQAMPLASRLEITHVHARPDGEAVFPPIDAAVWRAYARDEGKPGPGDEAAFTRVTYVRAQDVPAQRAPGHQPLISPRPSAR
jgi:dihydrofolate reductase